MLHLKRIVRIFFHFILLLYFTLCEGVECFEYVFYIYFLTYRSIVWLKLQLKFNLKSAILNSMTDLVSKALLTIVGRRTPDVTYAQHFR